MMAAGTARRASSVCPPAAQQDEALPALEEELGRASERSRVDVHSVWKKSYLRRARGSAHNHRRGESEREGRT